MTLRINVTDVETGDTDECEVADGDYVIICAQPCYVDGVQAYPTKGTHVLTVKGVTTSRPTWPSTVDGVPAPGIAPGSTP